VYPPAQSERADVLRNTWEWSESDAKDQWRRRREV
jgi:hypothetical protein